MRFSVQLPCDRVEPTGEFNSADAIAELALAIEDAGFDAAYVTEHPFPPSDWLESGGHHALDPFVALSVAAACTTRLRLHANILVLAYRNPFLMAKSIASLDVVSEGRVIVGVGAGYLEDEFRALGANFAERNEVADQALEAMRHAWTGEPVSFEGMDYLARDNIMAPRPRQSPHPPIWVGGNSARAMRRAVASGQGWSPFPLPRAGAGRTRTAAIETVDDLAARIARLRELEAEAGRETPLNINFVPFGLRMNSDQPLDEPALNTQLDQLAKIGVDWVSVGLPGRSRQQMLEAVESFGERVIPLHRKRA